jgi:hypothetical protein
MSTIANYRKHTRQTVEISGGLVLTVRRFSASDFLEIGEIPAAFHAEGKGGKTDPQFGNKLGRIALLNCVVGPADFKIVDSRTPKEDEISVHEISTEDTAKVLDAVTRISGLSKEAADSAKPFSPQ